MSWTLLYSSIPDWFSQSTQTYSNSTLLVGCFKLSRHSDAVDQSGAGVTKGGTQAVSRQPWSAELQVTSQYFPPFYFPSSSWWWSSNSSLSTGDVQLFGGRTSDCTPGEGTADSAASEHHQTQGGALPRAGRLAGERREEKRWRAGRQADAADGSSAVSGGHEAGDRPAGAAARGGATEGEGEGEGEPSGTPAEQVSQSEGGRRERILLLPFQGQVSKYQPDWKPARPQTSTCLLDLQWSRSHTSRFLLDLYICVQNIYFVGIVVINH